MSFALSSVKQRDAWPQETLQFCEDFCRNSTEPKYILGRNIYAECVASLVAVSGIIDDFTIDTFYFGLPVVKTLDIPKNALVLNASGGRPLSAKAQLDSQRLRNLDYFAFCKASGLPLIPIRFNEGFDKEFSTNREKYDWIYRALDDAESKVIFEKLIRFRFDYDISHLEGFTQRENIQYFENFLKLNQEEETFIDIGAYDGYTSSEFIKRCPSYQAVHAFEPDNINFQKCTETLRSFSNVHCHPMGLSSTRGIVRFDVSGSASKISNTGSVCIHVDRLDDVLNDIPTFLKMDIEGGESAAIEGAQKIISTYHPRLAISVYHNVGDFWRIPEQILKLHTDYEILLRHYTESIYETVMFFLPRNR